MNILITCDRLDCLGGLEEHVINKIKYLLNNGYRVHLDCNAISEYYLNKIKHNQLTISSPWASNWDRVLIDIGDFEPDVIHAHPFSAIRRGWIIKQKFNNAKFFITIHGEYAYKIPNIICDYTNKIILVNDKIQDYKNFETVVIQNGIDTKRFKPNKKRKHNNQNKRIITLISRLQDDKEIPVFEFLRTSNRLTGYTYINIIGDGMHLDKIKEKVFDLSKEQDYVFYNVLGSIANVERYIHEADLILGCDRVALEALCCETDVFYMGQGHWKDLIDFENYKDFLFSNKGIKKYHDNELVDRIKDVLKNRDKLGIQYELYNKIRNEYSLDTQMNKIMNLYENNIKGEN